nr:hypothetical protein [Tanacetum cinerariifolium]
MRQAWFMVSVEFIRGLADQDNNFLEDDEARGNCIEHHNGLCGDTEDGNFIKGLDEKICQKSNPVLVEEGDGVLDSEGDGVHLSQTNDVIQQARNLSTVSLTSPQLDSGLVVPVFKKGDDPIDSINKMMSFLSAVVTSCFPTTNNQLRNSSNPRQQATIHDGRVPHSENTHDDMLNQSVQEMSYSEQTHLNTNSSTQQDAMILYVFKQLSNQVTNYNKVNKDNANESLSVELERYKERVKLLEERQNVDLSTRENLIMDDIIREKMHSLRIIKEINYLKQTLSEQSKEEELLTKTSNIFKNRSKEKEAKNIDKEIALEKKAKELNNIKAQQIRPMLYDGSVIAKDTNMISIADSEETLLLEEKSHSKLLLKQSDPMVLEKKVNIKPINYAELNQLSKDFGKRFVPQQELSDEQAFRLQTSHPNTDQSASFPVKIEAHRVLPKITPNALTEGEWGFEHTKAIF